MGTRSLTYVYDGPMVNDDLAQPAIVCMYRQYDGYPAGHGQELTAFLSGMKLTNGYSTGQKAPQWANGMGCLAGQVVAHFKKDIGGIYLFPPRAGADCGQEYEYHVYTDNDELRLKIESVGWGGQPNKVLFDGPMADAEAFCKNPPEDD